MAPGTFNIKQKEKERTDGSLESSYHRVDLRKAFYLMEPGEILHFSDPNGCISGASNKT